MRELTELKQRKNLRAHHIDKEEEGEIEVNPIEGDDQPGQRGQNGLVILFSAFLINKDRKSIPNQLKELKKNR